MSRSRPVALATMLLVAWTGGAAAAAPSPTTAAQRVYGVTVDDPSALGRIVAAVRRLPHRQTVRLVLDVDRAHPADVSLYAKPARRLAEVADVMAELVDSSELRHISVDQVRRRTRAAMHALHDDVATWEVGNEVNGNWTGRRARVAAKVVAAYRVVAARGGRSALTLYYNHRCGDGPHELGPVGWSRRYLPHSVRRGLDDVLLSYYEPQCSGRRPSVAEWTRTFRRLHALFPNAAVGFGEIGMPHPATAKTRARAASIVRRYYGLDVALPYYVSGCFYWYFAQDMVPWQSSRLWHTLKKVIR